MSILRSFDLTGKTAIVTGGGRGLGRDIALQLAAAGANIVVNDLGGAASGEGQDAGPATEVVKEIEAAGGKAVANGDSVASHKAAREMVEHMGFEVATPDEAREILALKGGDIAAAMQQVHTRPAKHLVIAITAKNSVIASVSTKKAVVARASVQFVITCKTIQPIIAAIAPFVASHASSINCPRSSTTLRPSANENVPAAAWAVNSPSERPAAATGSKSGSLSLSAAKHARLCK